MYSQALRISRLCSLEEDFRKHCSELKSWLLNRNYPSKFIDTEMKKVKFNYRSKKSDKKETGVPFVLTFHPSLKNLNKIIKDNLYLLFMEPELKTVFSPPPMVSFKAARNISSYLVRSKLYPIERKVGSEKCGKKWCEVCKNMEHTEIFTSNISGEVYKINHALNCDDKCVIYLLNCNKCNKQYVGETTNNFRYRWNNYRCNARKFERKERCMQEHLFRHFEENGHQGFLQDISITLIDKTDGSNPRKRENFWIDTLNTLHPNGLNFEDSV